jgi:hypothetical protein
MIATDHSHARDADAELAPQAVPGP